MRIITLNTWGGRAGKEKLLGFFEAHRDTDIFCLQEIWSAPYDNLQGVNAGGLPIDHSNIMTEGMQEISGLLSGHTRFFRPHHLDNYGLMMLVKKDLGVVGEGEFFVYKEKGHIPVGDVGFHARNVQHVTVRTARGDRTVMNFHGLWNGQGKGDSEGRIAQSEKIISYLKTLDHPFVLCGDFNLLPDTESMKMLEDSGLRSLVREFGITSTRTSLYKKPAKHANYILVSEGVKVKDFRVLPDEVSDHAPLSVEIG